MLLLIAISLAVAAAAMSPLGTGLFDTSMWVAKVVTPSDWEDNWPATTTLTH